MVQNFSAEGMCIHTSLAPGVGETLNIMLVNGQGKKMTVQGTVARMTRVANKDIDSYKHSISLGLSLIEAPWEYFQLLGSFQDKTIEEPLHG